MIETSLFVSENLLKENPPLLNCWIKGNWPQPCMVLLLSCDKPWYQHCVSLPQPVRRCEGWGGPLNPSLFAFPSKGLCEECREFNWSPSVPVWLPALLPAHVLGTAELPETGHRSTTPPWETRQNENTFKEMSPTHFSFFESLTCAAPWASWGICSDSAAQISPGSTLEFTQDSILNKA